MIKNLYISFFIFLCGCAANNPNAYIHDEIYELALLAAADDYLNISYDRDSNLIAIPKDQIELILNDVNTTDLKVLRSQAILVCLSEASFVNIEIKNKNFSCNKSLEKGYDAGDSFSTTVLAINERVGDLSLFEDLAMNGSVFTQHFLTSANALSPKEAVFWLNKSIDNGNVPAVFAKWEKGHNVNPTEAYQMALNQFTQFSHTVNEMKSERLINIRRFNILLTGNNFIDEFDGEKSIPFLEVMKIAVPEKVKEFDERINMARCAKHNDFFTIYFNTNETQVSQSAKEILRLKFDQILSIENCKIHNVKLDSYQDTAGSNNYNKTLTERMNASVLSELSQVGVMIETITQKSHGENILQKNTNNDVDEPLNRRVTVDVTLKYNE